MKKHLDSSSLILIHSECRSDALSLGQEAFIDLFGCSCRMLEKGVVKICWDDYIVTFYGQVSASVEVLMMNPKLCFALRSLTSWFCCSEGKVHPITGNEGTEGEYRYSYSLSLSSALDGGGLLTPCPSRFAPSITQYPLYRMLGGTQGQSGLVQKIASPPRYDPWTVKPVVSFSEGKFSLIKRAHARR